MLNAQTNVTLSTSTAPVAPTKISSDMVNFDLKTRVAIYSGNVRVDDPRMKLSCEILTATAPQDGGRIESIVAQTNVVIDMVDENGETNHATGEKLVYTFNVVNGVTNETARLTINPRIEKPDFTATGDAILWNRGQNQLQIVNPNMVYRSKSPGETNRASLLESLPVNR
jgi:lipopolysaccharide transport protein LptA